MTHPPAQARITLPPWIWGGDPQKLIAECRYRSRPAGPDTGFLLQTEESYLRQRADLVRVRTVTGPGVQPSRYMLLAGFQERIEPPIPAGLNEVLEKRRKQAETTNELIDVVRHQMLLLYALPGRDLPTQARLLLEHLTDVPLAEDPTYRPFAHASVHVLEVDPVLLHRLKIASVMLRLEHDTRLGEGDLTHVTAEGAFGSSTGLYDGVYTFDAYLGPMLAAGSPGVWALNVVRTFGCLVIPLGSFVAGSSEGGSDWLQFVSTPGADGTVSFPQLSATAGSDAVAWWGERLNLLFGAVSDLAVFTDESGNYLPARHLQAMLTIEQIFRRTTSMLLAHRDSHGRRALFFTLLDSLESVTGFDILTMCKLSHAQATLDRLSHRLPRGAAEVLLPAAQRAVSALEKMQDGFFIRRQLGNTDLQLRLAAAEVKHMSLEEGVARYLKVLRDATHGHGSNKGSKVALTDALLAHHDGHVPHDIGLLAYLYLLDVLAEPMRLRRVLYRSGK